MTNLTYPITLIALLSSIACGGVVEGADGHPDAEIHGETQAILVTPQPGHDCLVTDEYRFAYSLGEAELVTAEPGEEFCVEGRRDQWCLYHGDLPSDGMNLLGPDAEADSRNPEACAPGFDGMGGMGGSH